MWKTVKTRLKLVNKWYDAEGENSRFYWMLMFCVPGIWLTQSSTGIVSFIGLVYLIILLVIRWMHIHGKL